MQSLTGLDADMIVINVEEACLPNHYHCWFLGSRLHRDQGNWGLAFEI